MAQAVRDIRRRIKAVRSTQQITRAMQMVAAARLAKSQQRAVSARAYSEKLREMLNRLVTDGAHQDQPLLAVRPVRRTTVLVLTSDRGLAGSYNTNIFRRVETTLVALKARSSGPAAASGAGAAPAAGAATAGAPAATAEAPTTRAPGVELMVVGRKGRDYFRRRGLEILREDVAVPDDALDELARELSQSLTSRFLEQATDEVILIYSKFVSALQQRPTEARLLPVAPPEAGAEAALPAPDVATDESEQRYIYEPNARAVYSLLLPKFVRNQVFHALLESRASQYAAQMTAMAAATDNAEEMIEKLTLEMHHARQGTITQEIMELVGGAEALKES